MICRQCGTKATVTCRCGAPCCGRHANYYFDSMNAAINRGALPECINCAPPKHPRPYTFDRAVERGEVDIV